MIGTFVSLSNGSSTLPASTMKLLFSKHFILPFCVLVTELHDTDEYGVGIVFKNIYTEYGLERVPGTLYFVNIQIVNFMLVLGINL